MHHLSPIVEQKSGDHFGETALVFNEYVALEQR